MTINELLEDHVINVASFAWGKLHADEETAPVEAMLPTMRAVLAMWLHTFSAFDSGNAISLFNSADAVLFDSALGCYVAALYVPSQQGTDARTPLIGVKLGPDEWKFAAPVGVTDFATSLIDEAWGYLQAIGIIADDASEVRNRPIIGRSGPRRRATIAVGLSINVNPLYSLYADNRSTWEWQRWVSSQ